MASVDEIFYIFSVLARNVFFKYFAIKFNIFHTTLTFIRQILRKFLLQRNFLNIFWQPRRKYYFHPRSRRLIIQSKQRGTGHQIGSWYFLLEQKNRNKISFNILLKWRRKKSSKLNFHGRKNFHNFPARLIYISLLFLYNLARQHNSIWISQ